METFISRQESDTKKIGGLLLKKYPNNRVFLLSGNLGSGKTILVQGAAESLGIKKNVNSPTFVIANIYGIKRNKKFKQLVHIDAYRLNNKKDLENIAFFDYLKQKDSLIMIEWGNKVKKYLSPAVLNVKFNGLKNNERKITIF